MKRIIIYLMTFIMAIFSTQALHAGAWTQKRGEWYYKLGLRIVRADEFYEPGGNKIDTRTIGDYTTTFYGEYGLNDWLTLVASAPIFKRITLNRQVNGRGEVLFLGDSKNGVADFDIGARVALLRAAKSVLSAEVLFGIPIGDDNQSSGLLTGDGEFNQLIKLQFGHSFFPTAIYFSGEAGFNNRTEGFSDEFGYAAELGYTFKNRLLFIFRLRGVESLKNGESSGVGGMLLFANNQSYLSYGPEINYMITRMLGVSAGIEGATRGENVLSAPAFSAGFFLK